MHKSMVDMIQDRIHDQFISEEMFCKMILEMPISQWNEFKRGNAQLPAESMQKIRLLFSDYEWMLLQKIVNHSAMFPEKRNHVVLEYKRLKSAIAKQWIKSGSATVDLVRYPAEGSPEIRSAFQKHVVNLRVIVTYGEWGCDDILEFFMPGTIQHQVGKTQVELLDWVDENLAQTYI